MNHYQVIDITAPLLSDIPKFEARNGKEAVLAYLATKGITGIEIERRGDNFVTWCVCQFQIIDGMKYRKGNRSWYGEKR